MLFHILTTCLIDETPGEERDVFFLTPSARKLFKAEELSFTVPYELTHTTTLRQLRARHIPDGHRLFARLSLTKGL